MDTINFFKQSKYYIYFVKFKSILFSSTLFKIGITTNLETRLCSLKQEYAIERDYELLLALQVNSPEIERDILHTFHTLFPHLKINLRIRNINKQECMLFHEQLIPAIQQLFYIYTQQINLHYIKRQTINTNFNYIKQFWIQELDE